MWPFSCQVCAEKDKLIEQLCEDLLVARGQVDGAKEREQAAVNALLHWQNKPVISTPAKMKSTQADEAHVAAFGFFRDAHDKGDGQIQDADQFPQSEPVH